MRRPKESYLKVTVPPVLGNVTLVRRFSKSQKYCVVPLEFTLVEVFRCCRKWFYLQPNWNPWFADGSRLVFLRNSKVVTSSPDGTQRTGHNITGVAGLPAPSPDGESIAYVTYVPRPMKIRPDLQFWGGTTIWVVAASAGSTPRAVTEKSEDEIYDLKWLSNSTVVFDRIADEVFYKNARVWKVTVR